MHGWETNLRKVLAKIPVMRHVINLHQDVVALKHMIHRTMIDEYLEKHLYQHPRYADPKRLNRFEYQVFSQSGEDGIIAEIFSRIGAENRFFVEFGVGNGTENNSLRLLLEGWHGLWIECDEKSLGQIRKMQKKFLREKQLTLLNTCVNAENIEQLLESGGVPEEPDLLCIDIDGNDYWVWKAINRFRPRVVVIEYNALYRPPIRWVRSYDPCAVWKNTTYYGASLASLAAIGENKGYALVGCNFTGVNAFFVRKDLLKDSFAAPYTAENHYERLRLNLIRPASMFPVELAEFEAI